MKRLGTYILAFVSAMAIGCSGSDFNEREALLNIMPTTFNVDSSLPMGYSQRFQTAIVVQFLGEEAMFEIGFPTATVQQYTPVRLLEEAEMFVYNEYGDNYGDRLSLDHIRDFSINTAIEFHPVTGEQLTVMTVNYGALAQYPRGLYFIQFRWFNESFLLVFDKKDHGPNN